MLVISLSSIGIDGVMSSLSPRLVRPRALSAAGIFSSLDLPSWFIDELCSDQGSVKFLLTVFAVCGYKVSFRVDVKFPCVI